MHAQPAGIRYDGWCDLAVEIKQHCPNVPIILLGCQNDRRASSPSSPRSSPSGMVPKTDAIAAGMVIGAAAVMECSAKTGANVDEVFRTAIRIALRSRNLRRQTDSSTAQKLTKNFFLPNFEATRARLSLNQRQRMLLLMTMWRNRHVPPASGTTQASRKLHTQLTARARRYAAKSRERSTLEAMALLVSPLCFRVVVVWRRVMQFAVPQVRDEGEALLKVVRRAHPKSETMCADPLFWMPRKEKKVGKNGNRCVVS